MSRISKRTSKKLTRRENALIENIRSGMIFSKAALAAGYFKKWPGQACTAPFKN